MMPGDFLILIACQLTGEALRAGLSLPVPGPVVGMLLLAAALTLVDRRRSDILGTTNEVRSLDRTAAALLSNMGLLFVPAGVGIIDEISILQKEWLPITAALIGSTVLSTAVTGVVMHWLVRDAKHLHRGAESKHS